MMHILYSVCAWDEALMSWLNNVLAGDRVMRDFKKKKKNFWDKIVIFCRDPPQTLPVEAKDLRAQTVSASLEKDYILRSNFTRNMSLQSADFLKFIDFL